MEYTIKVNKVHPKFKYELDGKSKSFTFKTKSLAVKKFCSLRKMDDIIIYTNFLPQYMKCKR